MRATMTFADRRRYEAAQQAHKLSPRQLQAILERLFVEQERLQATRAQLKREAAPSPERSAKLTRIRKRLAVVSEHISQTRSRYQLAAREALETTQEGR